MRPIPRGTRTKKSQKVRQFSYKSGQAPSTYSCSKCGSQDQKLWRYRGKNVTQLFCMQHAADECGVKLESVRKRSGTHTTPQGRTHEIGENFELVPAILQPDGRTYIQSIAGVSRRAKTWWNSLAVELKN